MECSSRPVSFSVRCEAASKSFLRLSKERPVRTFRYIVSFCIALVCLLFPIGCGSGSTEGADGSASWPYKFVASKTESSGHRNVMDIFAFAGELDVENMKGFCRARHRKSIAQAFYYVVVFDDAINAGFPSVPFTAWGADKALALHVRAVCEFNRLNGYSKLTYYENNSWESSGSSVDL